MTLVLVSREALATLLAQAWAACDYGEGISYLAPNSPIVTLAVEAGLPIPGPMAPGTVPPAPPQRLLGVKTLDVMERAVRKLIEGEVNASAEFAAPVYRADGDPRLRCSVDGKVVYGTEEQAEAAARRISDRQPMRHYLGGCGHWHVSRDRHRHGMQVARDLTED